MHSLKHFDEVGCTLEGDGTFCMSWTMWVHRVYSNAWKHIWDTNFMVLYK